MNIKNQEPIQVGLIGFGAWSREAYAPILNEFANVRVAAVAARSESTLQLARDTFKNDIITTGNYRQLLQEDALDVLMIAIPNALHTQVLEDAAACGKHLFFEPPMALDAAKAATVFDKLSRCDDVVNTDLELRCLPVIVAMQEHIDSGKVGAPRMARIRLACDWGYTRGPWFDEVQHQSFFHWLGHWYLDTLDVIFKQPAERACIVGGHAKNGRLMDHGWASLVYPDGRLGQFEFNLIVPQGTVIDLSVTCEGGQLYGNLQTGAWRHRGTSDDWCDAKAPASQPAHGFEGMRESIWNFFQAIRYGREPHGNLAVAHRVQHAAQLCADAESST